MHKPTEINRLYERLMLKFVEIRRLFRQIEERMHEAERIVLEEEGYGDTTPKAE